MIRVKVRIDNDIVVCGVDNAQGDIEERTIYLYDFMTEDPWCYIECNTLQYFTCALDKILLDGYFDFDQYGYIIHEAL